jgi:hypothetical protein
MNCVNERTVSVVTCSKINTMEEIWKPVNGYEGLYEVSNFGKVKCLNRSIIKRHSIMGRYPALKLSKNGKKTHFLIHRLVALHFMPNPQNKPQINHINGDRNDFRIENLEWSTQHENMQHAYRTGLYSTDNKGTRNGMVKLTEEQVIEIISLFPVKTNMELSKMFGVHASTISGIRTNERWCHLAR